MKCTSCHKPQLWFITSLIYLSFYGSAAGEVQRLGEVKDGVIRIDRNRDRNPEEARTRAYVTDAPKPTSGVHAVTLKDYSSNLGQIIREAERIIIPELQFKQAELGEAFDLLHDIGVPEQSSSQSKGPQPINVTLNLSDDDKKLLVTFDAQDISLLQAIKALTHLTGLSYRFIGNVIVVEPYNEDKSVSIVTPEEIRQGDITRARMTAVIFPEISYRSVPLGQIVEDLRETSALHDTSHPEGEGKKINLNLRYDGSIENRALTIEARQMSLYNAVKTICSTSGLKYTIRGNVVIMEAKPVPTEKK